MIPGSQLSTAVKCQVLYFSIFARHYFDLVHQACSLRKLSTYNLSIASITFFRAYVQGRLQCVLRNGAYSQEDSVTSGMPQRLILGPLLFCIFIKKSCICAIHVHQSGVIYFADDGTFNAANDNKDRLCIYRDFQQSLKQ